MATLGGFRVLRIGDAVAAAYCTKLLAGFGAESRCIAAPGESPDEACAAETAWFHRHDQRLPFDWSASGARSALRELLADTDILIDARRPGADDSYGLDADTLFDEHPQLVTCRITPFGLSGPYRDYRAEDITLYAMSGLMQSTGDGTREPLNAQPKICQVTAGLNAYIASLMALLQRERDGLGDFIELSMQESAMENYEVVIAEYLHTGKVARRNGDEHPLVPWRTYRCSDGEAVIMGGPMRNWLKAVDLFGRKELSDPPYAHMGTRLAHRKDFEALLRPWLEATGKHELFLAGQERGLAWSYLATLVEALDDEQHRAREFFQEQALPDGRRCKAPGAPFRASELVWRESPPQPLSRDNGRGGDRSRSEWRGEGPHAASGKGEVAPLTGIRVIDFTHDWAGPHAARLLADYGAEVVKIEYPGRLDSMRGGYPNKVNDHPRFWQLHRNKRSVTLDLKREDHLELCKALVRDSDLVIENSRPGVMDKLGLGFETLRALNPDIIVLSMTAFGADGPYSRFAGYGGTIEAISGLQALTAYSADGPRYRVREMDVMNGIFGACAAMTALLHRRLGGEGQWIDLSETETCCWSIGEFFAAASSTGEEPPIIGNRHLRYAPQGCYPCAGDDRWLTLCVTDDEQWQQLAAIVGGSALAEDARYATAAQRRARHDELDTRIEDWTRSQDLMPAMQRLQEAGIAAGAVLNVEELAQDPHLAARGWFQLLDGVRYPGVPFRMRRGRSILRGKGPDLGCDNAWIEQRYGELGLGDALAPSQLGTAFDIN